MKHWTYYRIAELVQVYGTSAILYCAETVDFYYDMLYAGRDVSWKLMSVEDTAKRMYS